MKLIIIKEKISNIINNSKIIALEIRAACDFSQDKDRLYKFLLGIKTPPIDDRTLINENRMPESCFNNNIAFFEKGNIDLFKLFFNFNYGISIHK